LFDIICCAVRTWNYTTPVCGLKYLGVKSTPSSPFINPISCAVFLCIKVKTFESSNSFAEVDPEFTNLGKSMSTSLYPPDLALKISTPSGANLLPLNLFKVGANFEWTLVANTYPLLS